MIELDWTLLLQAANFLILLLVLHLMLYRPILDILRRRRETIDGSLQRAKDLESQTAEKMARYQERLQEAKQKGSQEKMKLRQEAAAEEARMLSEAHENASEQLQTIKSRIASEADRARQTLKSETEALAAQIASKVLGRAV